MLKENRQSKQHPIDSLSGNNNNNNENNNDNVIIQCVFLETQFTASLVIMVFVISVDLSSSGTPTFKCEWTLCFTYTCMYMDM